MEKKNSTNQNQKSEETPLKPAEAAAQALLGTPDGSEEDEKSGTHAGASGGDGGVHRFGNLPDEFRKKKWMIPAGIAAAAAMVIGGVFLLKREDPKETVIHAFKSITAEGQLNPAEEIFGTDELKELLLKGSVQMGAELSLSGVSDESLNQLSGAAIGADLKNDVDSKRQLLGLSLKYGGAELADAEVYLDDTQLMAASPAFSGRVFTLDYVNDLEGQLINSPYAAQVLEEKGIDLETLVSDMKLFREVMEEEKPVLDLKALWKRYQEGSKANEDLKAAMTVEKADKKEFTIDGQKVNCHGYHVTLSKTELLRFVKTTREFFLKDETLKQDVIHYLELTGGSYDSDGDEETMNPEEEQKALWEQAEAVLDTLVEGLEDTIGDVTLDVYVRKDGKMAGFSYQTDASVEEETVRFYGDVSFGGGYRMLSNVSGDLHIEDSEQNVITLSLDKTGVYEAGRQWTGQIIAALSNGEESYQFVFDGDYQMADGSYEIKLDAKSNDQSQASLTASGTVSELLKGESVRINVDTLRLDTMLLNGGDSYLELAGSCYMNTLLDEIAQPSGVPFDVLASSEIDYQQVLAEITGNLFAILQKIGS